MKKSLMTTLILLLVLLSGAGALLVGFGEAARGQGTPELHLELNHNSCPVIDLNPGSRPFSVVNLTMRNLHDREETFLIWMSGNSELNFIPSLFKVKLKPYEESTRKIHVVPRASFNTSRVRFTINADDQRQDSNLFHPYLNAGVLFKLSGDHATLSPEQNIVVMSPWEERTITLTLKNHGKIPWPEEDIVATVDNQKNVEDAKLSVEFGRCFYEPPGRGVGPALDPGTNRSFDLRIEGPGLFHPSRNCEIQVSAGSASHRVETRVLVVLEDEQGPPLCLASTMAIFLTVLLAGQLWKKRKQTTLGLEEKLTGSEILPKKPAEPKPDPSPSQTMEYSGEVLSTNNIDNDTSTNGGEIK